MYLSTLFVAFKAQMALSRSCTRPNASTSDFPLIRTSPVPSTSHALADEAFLRPTPKALPILSIGVTFCTLLYGLISLLYVLSASCTSAGMRAGWIWLRRVRIPTILWYFDALTTSPTASRYSERDRHAARGCWPGATVGSPEYFRRRASKDNRWSLKIGCPEKYDGEDGTTRAKNLSLSSFLLGNLISGAAMLSCSREAVANCRGWGPAWRTRRRPRAISRGE